MSRLKFKKNITFSKIYNKDTKLSQIRRDMIQIITKELFFCEDEHININLKKYEERTTLYDIVQKDLIKTKPTTISLTKKFSYFLNQSFSFKCNFLFKHFSKTYIKN